MTPQAVTLIETETGDEILATLVTSMTAAEIVAAEQVWAPGRRQAVESAEHAHWDWSRKTALLARSDVRCFGIECAGDVQGMMIVKETGHFARLGPDTGRPLVYVEFLESAPWNSRAVVSNPRYRHVGRRLLVAAVELSRENGYGGRIGLHSLPQSEAFYETGCGMVPWGQDPEYHGLMYYEFTSDQAAEYHRGGT